MNVHGRLVSAVTAATSPAAALRSAAEVTAEALHAERCAVFVCRGRGLLELFAEFGPTLAPSELLAATDLAARAAEELLPVRGATTAAVAVPVAAIDRAIGAIVVERRGGAAFSAEETMRLSGIASQLVEVLESARVMLRIDRDGGVAVKRRSNPPPPSGERILRGLAASPGIAPGAATFRQAFPRTLIHRDTQSGGRDVETARVRDAVEKTRNDLTRLQGAVASDIGEEHALVFGAHLLLLNDPLLTRLVDEGIAAGLAAAVAVAEALDEIVRLLLLARDPYVQERVEDIEDLRGRILGHLVGIERGTALDARVVVSARTTPSLLVELKARGALGIVSELGGVTSHGVLLARALGVPAVTGIERLTYEVAVGDLLIVDGDEGCVIVRPTAETRADYERRRETAERSRTEFVRYRDRPTATADGHRVPLQANIAFAADLELAVENGAEGIGLYRTEFPFIVRDGLPTVEEQVRIYAKAYEAFPDGPVTLRILDLAGDKFLPSGTMRVSRDPFHGYRSIRILFDHPHVLADQVDAFAQAAAGRPLRILIPMITSVEDVVRVKELVAAALSRARPTAPVATLTFGAMIETPAAVELVADLAGELDFFSIGTNDLIQYSLVVDREDSRLASDRHAYHPAILRMIRRVILAAHAVGRPVAVCGEMASRPDLAIALLAAGIDALSVTPRAIPALKQALAQVAVEPLRAKLDALLAASSAATVEAMLRAYVADGSEPSKRSG